MKVTHLSRLHHIDKVLRVKVHAVAGILLKGKRLHSLLICYDLPSSAIKHQCSVVAYVADAVIAPIISVADTLCLLPEHIVTVKLIYHGKGIGCFMCAIWVSKFSS